MANLGQVFNKGNYSEPVNTIPEGEYLVHVVSSELKENSKGTGSLINFKFEVIEGEHKGFALWDYMNIIHTNPRAQAMGQKKLMNLQDACGFEEGVEDTVELHGIPVVGNVITKPADGKYPESSSIKTFMPESEYVPE